MKDVNKNQPLARVYRLEQLPGRLAKSMEVPPDSLGVALYRDGTQLAFPPGKHRLVSLWERLRGRAAGLRAGYIPAGLISARLRFSNLLSAESELLEASLVCGVEFNDPFRFFEEVVVPRTEIAGGTLDLGAPATIQEFGAFTRRYLAADLIGGLPTERLLPQITPILGAGLAASGLALAGLEMMLFWRSEDQVAAAGKALALQEQLDDIELQKKMLAMENQTQLDEFADQLEDEMGGQLGIRPVASTPSVRKPLRESLKEALVSLVTVEDPQGDERRYLHFNDLLQRDPKWTQDPPRGRKMPNRWWLGRAIWMVSVVLLAAGLTRLITWLTGEAAWTARLEITLAIWAFAVVAVLESLKVLFEKREEISEINWAQPGTTFIDDLASNRPRADALVRAQCSQDLSTMAHILDSLQTRLYQDQAMEMGVMVRKLKGKVERYQKEIQNGEFGKPPYLTDLKISRRLWDTMLDYDEQLLVRSSALNEDTSQIQVRYASGDFTPEILAQLENRLERFHTKFANRGQALRSTPEDQEPYRMKT